MNTVAFHAPDVTIASTDEVYLWTLPHEIKEDCIAFAGHVVTKDVVAYATGRSPGRDVGTWFVTDKPITLAGSWAPSLEKAGELYAPRTTRTEPEAVAGEIGEIELSGWAQRLADVFNPRRSRV